MTKTHILVTGASRGIGKAILNSFDSDTVRAIGQSTSGETGLLKSDFTSADEVTRLWQEALDRLDGRIDVLINNAGIFIPNPITNSEAEWLESWNRTLQINLTASAQLCRLAVQHFHENGSGGDGGRRIINIASRAAYRGDGPDHWHYAASKGGMVAMTKSIARAYASEEILAFAICPGFTMTGMAEDYLESRGGEKLLQDIPLGRVAQPEEIASIAKYCALDAPASMTGAILDANGASFVR
ncbi:SDR family oxidoreductase [Parasphingorhabdus sp. JC815]|uniref:SDR family NAD(P)-dependent oxidoreductase n=1 Tax=Parasphingorhabdus sp. JC815 TaxID=3232140 RepID=UPI0034588AD7